jgi:hypothetical protein
MENLGRGAGAGTGRAAAAMNGTPELAFSLDLYYLL